MIINPNSPLRVAREQLSKVQSFFPDERDQELFTLLKETEKVVEISIPVRMDDGSLRVFQGFRSGHSSARGPYKGGIRFHEGVTKEEVQALSLWMSLKCSVLDLPLGGGKGGVIVDPKTLSKRELEQLSRGYVRGLVNHLGKEKDIPAPDVNTNAEIMAWMADEYSRLVGIYTPGAFTGKPLEFGGSHGRRDATAQGGLFVLKEYLKENTLPLSGLRIIIQGAGNAGLTMARLLEKEGALIVGISDSSGGVYDEKGLSVADLSVYKKHGGGLKDFHSGTHLSQSELLTSPCDVLIPAALENQITQENVEKIQAKIILELANGPTSPEADDILFHRGVAVIPDILANAGGVTVSYFEQIQNNTNVSWGEEEVHEKLEKKMRAAAKAVFQSATTHNVSLRQGAYIIAIRKILDAMKARGTAGL